MTDSKPEDSLLGYIGYTTTRQFCTGILHWIGYSLLLGLFLYPLTLGMDWAKDAVIPGSSLPLWFWRPLVIFFSWWIMRGKTWKVPNVSRAELLVLCVAGMALEWAVGQLPKSFEPAIFSMGISAIAVAEELNEKGKSNYAALRQAGMSPVET